MGKRVMGAMGKRVMGAMGKRSLPVHLLCTHGRVARPECNEGRG